MDSFTSAVEAEMESRSVTFSLRLKRHTFNSSMILDMNMLIRKKENSLVFCDALSVKVIISPSILFTYHPNHGWMMIYHHSSLHFRQSYFLNREREEQQESQESHCYQNKICFMSSSFCQNVIIYIIVYANHSRDWQSFVSTCFSLGWRRPHNGQADRKEWCPLLWCHHPAPQTFVFIVSVCYLHLPRLG